MKIGAVALLALGGCRHGYRADVSTVADRQYMIRSSPDGELRSESIAAQHAHRRAAELCPAGYDVLESRSGVASSTEHVAVFGRRTVELPEVTLVVRCRTSVR